MQHSSPSLCLILLALHRSQAIYIASQPASQPTARCYANQPPYFVLIHPSLYLAIGLTPSHVLIFLPSGRLSSSMRACVLGPASAGIGIGMLPHPTTSSQVSDCFLSVLLVLR
ncbi:hypothetical protein IWX46DRAFT_398201 [Phyllosticta citricarpa]|uniref:Secreted protein n=1 Tax=Phyllosticta citricarpa TaxID=55181 RepID=A0ABR1MKL8_9PEZI